MFFRSSPVEESQSGSSKSPKAKSGPAAKGSKESSISSGSGSKKDNDSKEDNDSENVGKVDMEKLIATENGGTRFTCQICNTKFTNRSKVSWFNDIDSKCATSLLRCRVLARYRDV
jgi:hypothetical protein